MSFFSELKRRNVIRVGIAYVAATWLLTQVVETVFPVFGLPDAYIRLVIILLAIGFIPVLVLAWVFEFTPEGLKKDEDVDRSQTAIVKTGKKLDHAIMVVLALALGFFAYDKFVLDPQRDADRLEVETEAAVEQAFAEAEAALPERSVAVLPFANMSGDPANEPFTQGMHDALLTHLSRIRALRTISRTSVMQYVNTTKTIPQIGAELMVGTVLEGSIQRSGGRVLINVQLIDARVDEHLWAEIYDRELTTQNLFAVQGEIAGAVARALEAKLLPEEQQALAEIPTRSMEAYDLYLLGRHHQLEETAESLVLARNYFEQALEEDPDYVLTLCGLADTYLLLVKHENMLLDDALTLAEEAVDLAMKLDDTVAEAWVSLAQLRTRQNRKEDAKAAWLRALELDPNNFYAWYGYGNVLGQLRRPEDMMDAWRRAYELEPMYKPVISSLAGVYSAMGDYVRSRHLYERLDKLDKLHPTRHKLWIANTFAYSGDRAKAIARYREILALDPDNDDIMWIMSLSYAVLGDMAEAHRWVSLADTYNARNPNTHVILMYEGDFEGTVVYLEDKLKLDQDRRDILKIKYLFQASYLGGNIEAARSYLSEYLDNMGGNIAVSPTDLSPYEELLVASFWIQEGDESAGEPQRGLELVEEIHTNLTTLMTQGFNSPFTLFSFALANAIRGDGPAALETLDNAIDGGFRLAFLLNYQPGFDGLRNDPEFIRLSERVRNLNDEERVRLAGMQLAPYTPPQTRTPIPVSREQLLEYVGHYTDGNFVMRFYQDEKGQFTSRKGQLRELPLLASAQDEFYNPLNLSTSYRFVRDENGVVTHVMQQGTGSEAGILRFRAETVRFKAIEPPPPAVKLDRSILQRYEGIYAYDRAPPEAKQRGEADLWFAKVRVDAEDRIWWDLDNQPELEIIFYAETRFYVPGYEGVGQMVVDPISGKAAHMLLGSGRIDFRRQDED